ncbi:hypothetical protein NRB20_61010 [Nocardia sp. RB20]|uniref:Uncharacterized protein n=1 Tax=Nocardia macrotermitis TaxID=2585198 RepID=A0A7K0DB72_9NOCA|nr:hypothetical protein [Nocardia macrotermitis]
MRCPTGRALGLPHSRFRPQPRMAVRSFPPQPFLFPRLPRSSSSRPVSSAQPFPLSQEASNRRSEFHISDESSAQIGPTHPRPAASSGPLLLPARRFLRPAVSSGPLLPPARRFLRPAVSSGPLLLPARRFFRPAASSGPLLLPARCFFRPAVSSGPLLLPARCFLRPAASSGPLLPPSRRSLRADTFAVRLCLRPCTALRRLRSGPLSVRDKSLLSSEVCPSGLSVHPASTLSLEPPSDKAYPASVSWSGINCDRSVCLTGNLTEREMSATIPSVDRPSSP